jgi:hypothetical protein
MSVVGVWAMSCTACGAELILTNVVPDDTVARRGVEHHTFVCSGCHVTERRLVCIRHGREDDSRPMPEAAAPSIVPALAAQKNDAAAAGLFGRVLAKLRGH